MARKSKDSTIVKDAVRADAIALLKEAGLPFARMEKPNNEVLPFGVSGFDRDILGTGGIVAGIITHIWGPQRSGKTTMAYRLISQAQKTHPEKFVVYYDSEFAFDFDRAQDAGVDTDSLILIQGNVAEDVYAQLLKYVSSGACSIVILDTIANLISRNQSTNLDSTKEGGKTMPGEFAKITKAFARDFCRYIHQNKVWTLMLNQITQKIGVLYGDPTDFPGGENFKHNIQMSMRVRQAELVREGPKKEPVGIRIAVTVDKNKKAPERKTDDASHLTLYFKDGIARSKTESLLDDALRSGWIAAPGAGRFHMVDANGQIVRRWHGRDKLKQDLIDDDNFADQLASLVYNTAGTLPPSIIDESEMP